ncbi:MAG: four helix bundle protein [Candidatus Moranbacteria bacterium]|nr:four helix bundle protein [Candidatus Moranbacteria bacterium]
MEKEYLNLNNLEVYLLSRQLSDIGWKIYTDFDWKLQKIIGDQFIESTDSVGANIAEGYGRFHYLDKIKFYYNARASLKESRHWFELMKKRKLIDNQIQKDYLKIYAQLSPKLNSFIGATYKKVKKS